MKHRGFGLIGLCLFAVLTACQTPLTQQVENTLTNPEQIGIRWGIAVADMAGEELLAIRADERFTPASNTKIVTTMASYHNLDALSSDALNPGTQVFLQSDQAGGPPTLILRGGGDAMLSDQPECEPSCLAQLADAIAALEMDQVASVIGDDTLFAFERWGPGWSVEDLQYYYGTAVSALSLNDNLVWVELRPGQAAGDLAKISWRAGDALYEGSSDVLTTAPGTARKLRTERHPGSRQVRVYGTLPQDSNPIDFALAIDNPAERVTQRFAQLLTDRGITVAQTEVRHRPLTLLDDAEYGSASPDTIDAAPVDGPSSAPQAYEDWIMQVQAPDLGAPIATLPASPLTDSLRRISKDSENLHAEIALRRLGLLRGTGSRDYGVAALSAFLDEAGIPEQAMSFHGGSGMSVYNRITPRSMVRLIAFASKQSWFESWLSDQPIGGVDGSLERRFKGTSLEGKIFAKTGTLNGANALSGVMEARSGRRLIFSIIANDRPPNTRSAIPEMDAALVAIAEAY